MGNLTRIDEIKIREMFMSDSNQTVLEGVGIDDVEFSSNKRPVVAKGIYKAVLRECPIIERDEEFYDKETHQYKKTGRRERVFGPKFVIQSEEGEVFIYRNWRPILSDRSNLSKDLSAMAPAEFMLVEDSHEKCKELIKSLIGKPFRLKVDVVKTKAGTERNSFVAISPYVETIADVAQKAKEEDDLPF